MYQIVLLSEPKNLDAWSWIRSLIFEFRFHSPGAYCITKILFPRTKRLDESDF